MLLGTCTNVSEYHPKLMSSWTSLFYFLQLHSKIWVKHLMCKHEEAGRASIATKSRGTRSDFFFFAFQGLSQARGPIGAVATGLWCHSHSQIQDMSTTYTTPHSKAGSLTHWMRPGIEPVSSWILGQIRFCWAKTGTPGFFFLTSPRKFPGQGSNLCPSSNGGHGSDNACCVTRESLDQICRIPLLPN